MDSERTQKFPNSSYVYIFILFMLNAIVFTPIVYCISIDKWFSQTWKIDDIEYIYIGALTSPNSNIIAYCPVNQTLSTNDILEFNKITQSSIISLCNYTYDYSECKNFCDDSCQTDCDFLETWDEGGGNLLIIFLVGCIVLGLNAKGVLASMSKSKGMYLLTFNFWISAIVYTACAILQIVLYIK
ncbi:hypothetical protein SteCoe_33185 [Stentor coeruleus]|uniref:Uncharacterized protein n=1 Tax=Stentor coeruleus TaxID=5963 RepID=A0A1R2AXD8_9CILI|nr:hypothetical protein SteCoe_33185 [Stentor coeruleus]